MARKSEIKKPAAAVPALADDPDALDPETPRKMLDINRVLEIVPVGRSTLFRMEKAKTFPPSHYISPNRRIWYADEIAAWQNALPTNRRISRHKGRAKGSGRRVD